MRKSTDRGWKVLLVEDDPNVRDTISRSLSDALEHIDLLVSKDGQAGLAIAQEELPDLLITDWEMPQMSGIELIQALQQHPETAGIPVILITGVYLDGNSLQVGLDAGAIEFVRKPVEPLELCARVRALLNMLHYSRELALQREEYLATQLRLEQELAAKAIAEAEREKELATQSERIKRHFFSRIAHEFRTPLSLVLGPLESIVRESREANTQAQASTAFRNSKFMLQLIDQLLHLERVESGHQILNPGKHDLNAFLQTCVDHFQELAQSKNLQLVYTPTNEALPAEFDPNLLTQVANNLLSNAIKFTQEGGSIRVSIQELDTTRIAITFQDTGIGIAAEQLPFLFDAYYRHDSEQASNNSSGGLGLPLVRELLQLHGGMVEASSEAGKGSIFQVILPRKLNDHAPQQTVALILDEPPVLPSDTVDSPQDVVLIVDDNLDICNYVQQILTPGYHVFQAHDVHNAQASALANVPDLIILDVNMPPAPGELPAKVGYDFCQSLKEHPTTCHIPIVLLTYEVLLPERIVGLESGADAHLGKPFHSQELQLRVRKLIELRQTLRKRYQRELLLEPEAIEATSMDEQFLLKLRERMTFHLDNELLTTEELANEMALSRTQFHRKLKALTGENATSFMRNFRLERAYQLLCQQAGTVSDVADWVGFGSLSYFSRAFSARFGQSPRELQKAQQT